MVRQWHGTIETLADVAAARRALWALCCNCGHTQRLDPRELAALKGPGYTLRALEARLACQRCRRSGRAAVVVDRVEAGGRDRGEVAREKDGRY